MFCRPPLRVFAAALLLRLTYVWQIRDVPYFDVPLIDSANYFRLAEAIAAGDLIGGRQAFWQPPLYPYFLAALIRVLGPRMEAILTAQAMVGALSCVLLYFVGRRIFHERAAVAASLIMAAYGPLIHFDGQPLIPVLHIALVLGSLLLILKGAGIPGPASAPAQAWGWAGLLLGLAAVATPNVLFAVPPIALWSIFRRGGTASGDVAGAGRGPGTKTVGVFLLGVAAPIALVAGRNVAVAREPILISSNAGINFYIGNNPDYERTIRIRPGGEFERLAQEPENLGIVSVSGRSRYFAGRAFRFIRDYRGQALRLYGRKVLDLIAGREIPRNQDQYVYRRHSWLFAILLWRAVISFPFGLVAPLALAGVFAAGMGPEAAADAPRARRSGRALLLLYASAYAVSILIFFPTDRYRLPLVPVLTLFAGNLLASSRSAWKRPAVIFALAAGLVIFNLDAFKAGEAYPEEEALNRAYALRAKGRLEAAAEEYRRAIALNPRRIDPHNALAAIAAREGRWDDAARHYEDQVALAPDFAEGRRNLGQAYLALGRREEALREWEIAVRLAPGAGLALADLCLAYLDEGLARTAEAYCARAVAARPDLPETRFAYGLLARSLRRRNLAWKELTEASRLFPSGSPGRRRAEEILEELRRGEGGRPRDVAPEPSPE